MKRIKKVVATLTIASLALTVMPFTVFAGGHGGGHGRKHVSYTATAISYSTCNIEGCNLAEIHKHNNINYYGHSFADGHDYHLLCGVQNCTIVGNHEHDGTTYFGHHNEDGHNYHGDGHRYHNAEHSGSLWPN